MLSWWQHATVLGVTPASVALAVAAGLLAYVLMATVHRMAVKRLAHLATQTRTQADNILLEVLGSTQRSLMALAAVLIGVGLLDLPERWSARVGQLWFLAVALQLALWANRLIRIGLQRHVERHAGSAGPVSASAAATLLAWALRTLLWSVVLLGMLSNLGVNITAFVASLGVGGIAVALAAQNILGDLFASLAIVLDKPFEVGDFIVLGAVSGTVENVGLKTTRIRSLGGEQVVMSNTELLKQTISNYKRLAQRRIVFGFGVKYGTPPDLLAQIPGIVERAVKAGSRLRFDRAHFKALGESSLDFEVVYIVLDADYNLYMDEQQRINLELMRELAARGVEFALPSRTVYVAPTPSRPEEDDTHAARPPANGGGAQTFKPP
jgi:small-conductance mechanosensitive channel